MWGRGAARRQTDKGCRRCGRECLCCQARVSLSQPHIHTVCCHSPPHPHPAHSCDLSPPGTALAPSLFLRTKVRVCSSGGSSLQTLRVVLRRSFRSLVEQHAYLAYFQIFQRFPQFASALAAAVSLVVCGRAVALWPFCVRRPYSGGHVAGIAKCGCDV